MTSNAAKNFDILTTNLSVLHNYLNDPTKLFSDLYLVKFLDILAKSFFFHVFILGILCDIALSPRYVCNILILWMINFFAALQKYYLITAYRRYCVNYGVHKMHYNH